MHALDRVSRSTTDPEFNAWARELAAAAHAGFTYLPCADGTPRMYWKMSIDLTRPLVPSMGQHDPLDGYVTALQLRATVAGPALDEAIRQFGAMAEQTEWASPDPLGIGGLLTDAYRVAQLMDQGALAEEDLLEQLLAAAVPGLQYYASSGQLQAPAEYRLAARELGLASGLEAVKRMWHTESENSITTNPEVHKLLQTLMSFVPLGEQIESFWLDPAHRRASTWSEHLDINEVMLATCLVPDGFLVLGSPD